MNRPQEQPLDDNALANRIESGLASAQPMIPAIIGGLVILCVGAVIWGVYSNGQRESQSQAWTEFYYNISGADAESYLDVAEGYPGSTMAGWAQQAAGDNYLIQGIDALYRNRKEGEDNLKLAIDTFEGVLGSNPSDDLERKATLGLARANESLGDLAKAQEYYEKYISLNPPVELMNAVNRQLAFINSPTGKGFYDWFSKLEPKPDAAITLPDNLSLPPTTPDLEFAPDGEGEPVAPINLDGIELPDLSAPEAKKEADIDGLELPTQEASSDTPANEETSPAKDESAGEASEGESSSETSDQ
ncbi:MAG: tetratricopeptide repeat protein [Aureliella sp.]